MTGFGAAPIELQVCGSMVSDIQEELRAELSTLRGEVDGLLSTGWQGQAATGFAQGWDEWQNGAQEVLTALQDMAELLSTTGRNYGSTDQAASDQLGSTGAEL